MLAIATESVAGAFAGGLLLGVFPARSLLPLLAGMLLLSAAKVWRHRYPEGTGEFDARNLTPLIRLLQGAKRHIIVA